MMGYIIRALKNAEVSEEIKGKIFQGLSWAKSEMTMEDARKEYERYYNRF